MLKEMVAIRVNRLGIRAQERAYEQIWQIPN